MSVAELPPPATHTPPPANGRAASPRDDPYDYHGEHLFEVVQGRRVEKPMGLIENMIAGTLNVRLGAFLQQFPIGWPVIETMFAIPGSGNDRKPDVAFVSYARWAANRPIPRVPAWPIAPDLATEVISPTDKAFDILEKLAEYFRAGVRQVWHVYSHVEQVYVYTSPTQVRILTRADELTGDPVIPGFRLPLAELFPLAEPTP